MSVSICLRFTGSNPVMESCFLIFLVFSPNLNPYLNHSDLMPNLNPYLNHSDLMPNLNPYLNHSDLMPNQNHFGDNA